MSIGSIPGGSIANWPSAGSYTKSAPAAGSQADGSKLASLMSADAPYDSVSVSLPNGISVGVFNFGGTGLDSTALKTIEDFVERLASQNFQGQPASGADGTVASSDAGEGLSVAGLNKIDVTGLEKIHIDLPNGISFEVRHSSGGQASDSGAVMKELTDAAEELAEVFGKYSPASSAAAAYATSQAALSSPANQVDTRT